MYDINNTHFNDKKNPYTVINSLIYHMQNKSAYCDRCFMYETKFEELKKEKRMPIKEQINVPIYYEKHKIKLLEIYKEYKRLCVKYFKTPVEKAMFKQIYEVFSFNELKESIKENKPMTFDSDLVGRYKIIKWRPGVYKNKKGEMKEAKSDTNELFNYILYWKRPFKTYYRCSKTPSVLKYIQSLTNEEIDNIPKHVT